MSYYRNVIQVEVLSTEPWNSDDLENFDTVLSETRDGGSSGQITIVVQNEQVSRERMAELLTAQNSSPEFLLSEGG